MAQAITTERRAFERSLGLARHSRQSRGGSLDSITCAGAVSNRKTAISTEAPPPKSLEVEPGNEASQDDILDDVIAHHQWMM